MSGFRRLCLAVFSLSGLCVLACFALSVYGPWVLVVEGLLENPAFLGAVAVLGCLTALGLVVCLGRALFARKVKVVEVAQVDGGVISITKDAIAAQARHVVEEDGSCRAGRVRVEARRRGHVRVFVRVVPREPLDVVAKGAELHALLIDGLSLVCGSTVQNVSLEFVEPDLAGAPAPEPDEGAASAGRQKAPVVSGAAGEIRVALPARDVEQKEA